MGKQKYFAHDGVITNVECLAIAIFKDPGQNGANYRKKLFEAQGRVYHNRRHRGWYAEYFRTVSSWEFKLGDLSGRCFSAQTDGSWFIQPSGYARILWKNLSEPGKRHCEWFLTEFGLAVAHRGLRKLEEAGLCFDNISSR